MMTFSLVCQRFLFVLLLYTDLSLLCMSLTHMSLKFFDSIDAPLACESFTKHVSHEGAQ